MNLEAEQTLVVRKVRATSIYKLLFLGLLLCLVPLSVVFGVAGFLGADTVKWNKQPIHGVSALFAGPMIGLFVTLLFTAFLGTLASVGLWLLSRFRTISIRVVMAQQDIRPDGLNSSESADSPRR